MILSEEPAVMHCGLKDVVKPLTLCHCLRSQLQRPLACLSLLSTAKKETRYFSLLGEQSFLSATPETKLLIILLCCSPLWAIAVLCLEESSCGTHLCCSKTSFPRANKFSYKKESVFLWMWWKAFSFTFLKLYSLVSRLICVYVRARTSNDNKPELNQSSVLY